MLRKLTIFLMAAILTFTSLSILLALDKKLKLIEKRGEHFIVYSQEGVDNDFVNDIMEAAERYYNEIADNLGFHRWTSWSWDRRAEIYIYLDKFSYQSQTNQPEWSAGCADYQNKRLWTYPHAAGFFDSILPHELGHIIFRESVGFVKTIPLWFDEGIASFQEKSKRYAAKGIVKDLLQQNRLLSIEELSKIASPHDLDKQTAEAFYAQAVSIVYFIINNFGKNRFVIFCRNLKDKYSFDEALDKTYYQFKGTNDLYKKWLQYIKAEGRQTYVY